jgi:hypothetical protein
MYFTCADVSVCSLSCTQGFSAQLILLDVINWIILLVRLFERISSSLRLGEVFRKTLRLYGKELPPRRHPKLEDNPLSSVRRYLLNILAAILLTGGFLLLFRTYRSKKKDTSFCMWRSFVYFVHVELSVHERRRTVSWHFKLPPALFFLLLLFTSKWYISAYT